MFSVFRRYVSICLTLLVGLVALTACGSTWGISTEPSANEVFKNYYSALTGTMSASEHRDDYQWRDSYEKFPYPNQAKWTDFAVYITSCDNKDIARMDGMYDTYGMGIGYKNPQEATDKVASYWKSQGWDVKDITSEKEPDMRQILTTMDTDINLLYTAISRGEAIEATSKCIPEFYQENNPAEEPVVYLAQK